MQTHKVEDVNRGLYTVDGSLHTRKDLQLVKGNVIKAPTKTKAQQKQRDIQDKVGKSLNNPEVKDLVGTRTKKETKEILESDRKTRSQTIEKGMTLRTRNKQIPLRKYFLFCVEILFILYIMKDWITLNILMCHNPILIWIIQPKY